MVSSSKASKHTLKPENAAASTAWKKTKRLRSSKEPEPQSRQKTKNSIAKVAEKAASAFGGVPSISYASAKGALQGLEPLSLSIGYAACAAALGAAAAAAAEMKPHCDAEEVAAAAMLAVEEILGRP